jgi:hypothetical protein
MHDTVIHDTATQEKSETAKKTGPYFFINNTPVNTPRPAPPAHDVPLHL